MSGTAPAAGHGPDVADLVARARAGEPRAVGRLISLVEEASPRLREVMAALVDHAGGAYVIGVTGAPGVGKSTTTSALVRAYRARGARVGVLAVDPSSPLSGGALLGDRVRMAEHADDDGVYVRSMAARGHLGGLARAAPQGLRVLDAAGCDVIVVETVGVGQSEVEVAGLADATVVLLAPGAGDAVQVAKAGVLELGDVYVVNKADRDGAEVLVRDLTAVLALAPETAGRDGPTVVRTVATRAEGVADLLTALDTHRERLAAGGGLVARRRRRVAAEIEAVVLRALHERIAGLGGAGGLDALADQVVAGELDPYAAADRLLVALTS